MPTMYLEAGGIRLLWAQNQLRAAILQMIDPDTMTDASSVEPALMTTRPAPGE